MVEAAKKLKEEAAEIEKELKYVDTLKNNLRAQEIKLRESYNMLQSNKETTVKDVDDLSKSFGQVNE